MSSTSPELTTDVNNMEIFCDKNGIETPLDEISAEFESFSRAYNYVCRMVDELNEITNTPK